jgi:uroporphyrinogen decarboxylase
LSTRQKYFTAMKRLSASYVPFEFSLCPVLFDEFERRTGKRDYAEYYGFPIRNVGVDYIGRQDKFSRFFRDKTDLVIDPDWGVGHKKGSMAHFTRMQPPMKDFECLADFEAYPYPDAVSDYDWTALPECVRLLQKRDLITVATMYITIFEIAWYMRGMETFLMDLLLHPELAAYHLDRITAIRCAMAERYAEAGCDVSLNLACIHQAAPGERYPGCQKSQT